MTDSDGRFVPGPELSERFFHEVIRPLIDECMPGLRYSAGLIGHGSEVLGYDDPTSKDHHWGPRVMIFCDQNDFVEASDRVVSFLAQRLPGELDPIDWLTIPQQKLLTLVTDNVFCDGLDGSDGTPGLNQMRRWFKWYPDDVWRYLIAANWARVGQEDHLLGRAGHTNQIPTESVQFFAWPFHVIGLHGISEALLDSITAPWLTDVMRRSPIGGIDSLSDNTDLREDVAFANALRTVVGAD